MDIVNNNTPKLMIPMSKLKKEFSKISVSEKSFTITTSNWSTSGTYVLNYGMALGANDLVFFGPNMPSMSAAQRTAFSESGIYESSQTSTNMTVAYTDKPTQSIIVKLVFIQIS